MRTFAIACAAIAFFATPAHAETVKLIVGFPPGSATDVTARKFAKQLEKPLGKSVVVENVPGASGALALNRVMDESADGLTVFFASSATVTVAPFATNAIKWNVFRDIIPVVHVASTPAVFAVCTREPYQTLGEYIAAARKSSEPFLYAAPGKGTVPNFIAAELSKSANIALKLVTHQGFASIATDLIGCHESAGFVSVLDAKKGMRPLAVSSPARSPFLPNVPTFKELGYKGGDIWMALYVKNHTPREMIDALAAASLEALKHTDLDEIGVTRTGYPAHALAKIQNDDYRRWLQVWREMQ